MRRQQDIVDVPCAYEVVGEHLLDASRLLVIADDGSFYALNLADGHIEPTDLTDLWVVDTCDWHEKLRRPTLNNPSATNAS